MNLISVIIVEDDRKIAEIQQRFLARISGFELVGIAHGLEEAEDLIDVLKPDLILLDIQFPNGTGLDLLRQLRAKNSQVDVILITAAKEVDTLRDALRGGVFDYILKPLVYERLKETLNHYQLHLNKLEAMHSLAQQDVDTLLPRGQGKAPLRKTTAAPAAKRLPKGIDGLTLENVKAVFTQPEAIFSAEAVGEQIGASRTTARRYLEYLVRIDVLDAEVSYGTVGRPERRYCNKKTGF